MSIDEFLEIVGKEFGLHFAHDEMETDFDRLAGWDSLHLLKLLSALEAAAGRTLPATRFLEARSLADLHRQVGAAEWR